VDLFASASRAEAERNAPLAVRMRPRNLDEFIGQQQVVGPNTPLRRAVEHDRILSLILWGPPGSGKTTLAHIIANHTQRNFASLNAVTAGVADIRRLIEEATQQRNLYGKRTIVFIDEIHRFNRAQQDALLPAVEDGLITLVGATTENPFFEVNAPLISRSRIIQLRRLTAAEIEQILQQAVTDKERGYGHKQIELTKSAIEHWANVSEGDARTALNALEMAVETAPPTADGVIRIDLAAAEAAIQRRALTYSKSADEHYDTISAFIKSVRGSDPDAALYWLAKMIYAGEDARFIMRRLFILAAEDIGLADPQGVVVVSACAQALQWCGLPEGQYHLAMATLYLATAPKSNSTGAYFKALADIESGRDVEVPNHLKDSSRGAKRLGHGQGYVYPHSVAAHWVKQSYAPPQFTLPQYYQASNLGYEQIINRWLLAIRRGEPPVWGEKEGGEC
jgi:putative ATPase